MEEPEPSTHSERVSGDASTSAGDSEPEMGFDWEKTYLQVKDKPLSVDKVIIKGLERTKSYLVARELEPLQQARSLDEIKNVMIDAHENLKSLDVFNGVEVIITDSDTVRNLHRSSISLGGGICHQATTCLTYFRIVAFAA